MYGRGVWEGSRAFARRWRLAHRAQPGQYELVEVPTKAWDLKSPLVFQSAILRAEAEAERPFGETMVTKRERLSANERLSPRPS
jgi:hypothetical protein